MRRVSDRSSPRRFAPWIVSILWFSLLLVRSPLRAASAQSADPFAHCDGLAAEQPDEYASYRCYWTTGAELGLQQTADTLLAAHERSASEAWPTLVRGHLAFGEPARALELYRRADERFANSSHRDADLGRVLTLGNRRLLLRQLGRFEEAQRVVEEAIEIGRDTAHQEARIRAALLEAQYQLDDLSALGPALRAFERAEAAAFPDGPPLLQRWILDLLATVYVRLGRFEDAERTYQRWRHLAEVNGQQRDLPTIDFNLINVRQAALELLPDQRSRQSLIREAEEALQRALKNGDQRISLFFHRALAELWKNLDDERAWAHVETCRATGRALQIEEAQQCEWIAAELLAKVDPSSAMEVAERASKVAATATDPTYRLWAARSLLQIVFHALPPELAVQRALRALAEIEKFHASQSGLVRAEFRTAWLEEAKLLVGRLVEMGRVDAAFELAEQVRAELLLSELELGGARQRSAEPWLASLQEQITSVQRDLIDPHQSAERRRVLLEELRRLEMDEAAGLERSSELSGAAPRAVGIERVQRALGPREALLSFVIGLDEDLYGEPQGGAWLFWVTARDVGVVRVADRLRLHSPLRAHRGLFRAGAAWSPAPARVLRDLLLDPAIAELGAEIDTLLIAPDGALHELSFASLFAEEDDAGSPRKISVIPSASAFALLRERRQHAETDRYAASPGGVVLVASSPTRPATVSPTTVDPPPNELGRPDLFAQAAQLPRLPDAERELRGVRRLLAAELDENTTLVEVRSEPELEAALTAAKPVKVLHIAAHALVDPDQPLRSSIVLTSGDSADDGLLQSREISRLPLGGAMVILSACDTAAGKRLESEGVLSLARSFFEAGASSVVATRWPLRDDHARELVELLYRRLILGEDLAEAITATRSIARGRGLPAEAWAGLVLLGEPSTSLAGVGAGGGLRSWVPPVLVGVGLATLLLSGLAWRARERH